MKRSTTLSAAVYLLFSLLGCGSNPGPEQASGPVAVSTDYGRVVVTVHWPDQADSREIPADANRLLVYVSGPDVTQPAWGGVDRPAGGGTSIITVENVPTGVRRWLAAEARVVDEGAPPLSSDSLLTAVSQQGVVIAASGAPAPVAIFAGRDTAVTITLRSAGEPVGTVSGVDVVHQQTVTGAFPSVLLLNLIRDADGAPLTNLNAANFELYEDGLRAPILDVRTVEAAQTPLSVALVLDRSGSMEGQPLADLQVAAHSFLELLGDDDAAELISFSDGYSVDVPFSRDQAELHAAVDNLGAGGWTALWSATLRGVDDAAERGGRSAVLAMTDGINNTGSTSLETLIEAARRKVVPVFAIGLGGATELSLEELTRLATETGGLSYQTPESSALEAIYRDIAKLLAAQMQLSFLSPDPTPSSRERRLRLVYRYGAFTGEVEMSYVAAP